MLSKVTLPEFKESLTGALRTIDQSDPEVASRFVELRPGMIRTLRSPHALLLSGRRGVGKSTALAVRRRRGSGT
jgi:2-phosphoglycerate kinase